MVDELVVTPAMPASGTPTWPGATWVGAIERQALHQHPRRIPLQGAAGYTRCRLLIKDDGLVVGVLELPVAGGCVDPHDARAAAAALPARAPKTAVTTAPTITVTISTRNRADQLATVLESLSAIEYPGVTFLIVDNASDDDRTAELVAARGDDRFRCVREDRVGLSYGRNCALLAADTDVVAFTDDDVVVDAGWVAQLAAAFRRSPDIALVTGMVPTGELRTPAQQYFEHQTGWQNRCETQIFRLAEPPADVAAFPLDVGRYGTGANFAVRRDIAIRLGGFNEALGIGSPTHGGEDLDMFLRVLYAGWALCYSPDAVVWHRHRADAESLERAVVGYSVSFTAWMASMLENPLIRRDAIRIGAQYASRRIREIVHDRRHGQTPPIPGFSLKDHGFDHLPRVGLRALADGPAAYVTSRRAGRRTRPLLGERTRAAS